MHDESGSASNEDEANNARSDGDSTSTSSDQANSPLRFDESNEHDNERLSVPLDLWELQLQRARSLVTTNFLNKLVMHSGVLSAPINSSWALTTVGMSSKRAHTG